MSDLDILSRRVGSITFPYPVMVAGGVFKTVEQLLRVAPTEVIPEWGSIETEPSSGNGGRDYYTAYRNDVLLYTLNSRGIPNPGMKYVEQHAPDLIKIYAYHNKPLALNISGKGPQDTVELLKRALALGFPMITVNVACPNKGDQPIMCYDKDAVSYVVRRMRAEIGQTDSLVFWKVSASMPHDLLRHHADVVIHTDTLSGIITGNTVPFAYDIDVNGATCIRTEKNTLVRGGMGGPAILPVTLGNTKFCVDRFRELGSTKHVIGVGGIMDAGDVMKYLRTGASLTQLNSAYTEAKENPLFIQELCTELVEKLWEEEEKR